MDTKQGPEKTEVVKEEGENHEQYILQKNAMTKTAAYIIGVILVIIVTSIIISALFFGNPTA